MLAVKQFTKLLYISAGAVVVNVVLQVRLGRGSVSLVSSSVQVMAVLTRTSFAMVSVTVRTVLTRLAVVCTSLYNCDRYQTACFTTLK